jgi:hypothetical protein
LKLPHPQGTDLGDIRAILFDPSVPSTTQLAKCDADLKKLWKFSQNDEERRDGARELVRGNAVFYHWCFYSRILQLDEELKKMNYIDEKQKRVMDTYQYLVPVARAFLSEFHDSRYIRWAIVQYKRLSNWVFFRKVELTPDQTSELVQISNPFGLYRDNSSSSSVLEKYGIVEQEKKPDVMLPPNGNEKTAGPSAAEPEPSGDLPVGKEIPAIVPESK